MKKKTVIILTAVAVAWYLFSSDNAKQPSPQVSPGQHQTQSAQNQLAEPPQQTELIAAAKNWPFSGNDKDIPLLDSDLNRKNFLLIFDGSGSMSETKCSGTLTKAEAAKAAVQEWSVSVDENANLGLIVFDEQGLSLRLDLGINNRDMFRKQIEAVVPNYKTPLTESVNHAYQLLTDQAFKQLGYGEYTIVVVTDGVADDSMTLAHSVNRILAESPVMISTIGFCIAADHSLNQPGRTFYTAANNPAALRQGLQAVLAESESFDVSAFQ